jgi:periplasmic protein TonB
MFDLITGKARHLPSHSTLPIMISTTAQAAAAAAALVTSALLVTERIPEMPTVLAFVAPAPQQPTAPPPPAQRSAPVKTVTQARPVAPASEPVAPVDVANTIEPEPAGPISFNDGVPGGVEGGIPGGLLSGVVGGLPEPPPPPPELAERAPVRVGGQIRPPILLHRVEPVYPPAAAASRLQGVVILEALVDRDGTVADVKVLRSAGSVLDREALSAVRQWRYSPLVLNGQHLRFVLTVVLAFSVERGA